MVENVRRGQKLGVLVPEARQHTDHHTDHHQSLSDVTAIASRAVGHKKPSSPAIFLFYIAVALSDGQSYPSAIRQLYSASFSTDAELRKTEHLLQQTQHRISPEVLAALLIAF